ncbi:hypothetical protein MRX96_054930 [Rhipicephalus microplus]
MRTSSLINRGDRRKCADVESKARRLNTRWTTEGRNGLQRMRDISPVAEHCIPVAWITKGPHSLQHQRLPRRLQQSPDHTAQNRRTVSDPRDTSP